MTCEQGLLRLLWGGPEVGVLRHWVATLKILSKIYAEHVQLKNETPGAVAAPVNWNHLELAGPVFASRHTARCEF